MKPEWFSGAELSSDRRYRYRLWRRWNSGEPIAYWIMLNPSTADERLDDATIRRCFSFSSDWGFGGMEVVNLFAFRATQPDSLLTTSDPVGPRNDEVLKAIAPRVGDLIIAAWGCFPQRLGIRDKQVFEMLQPRKVMCLGMTIKGYPKHPLYLGQNTELEEFLAGEASKRNG